MNKAPIRKIVDGGELAKESSKFFSADLRQGCGIVKVGGHQQAICLITNSKKLMKMWECNFPQTDNPEICYDGVVEVYEGEGESVRLYDKQKLHMLITNNGYYGCVKYGYRAICSDFLRITPFVTLHSAALIIDGKVVVIVGASGAGKTTIFNYLDKKYDGIFLWDDWGVVSNQGEIFPTNDEQYHMAEKSVRGMLPDFSQWPYLLCEKRKNKKYMVPLHFFRKTARNQGIEGPIQVDTIILLNNYPFPNVQRINSDQACRVFSRPAYSTTWDCEVPFMNEHLLMTDEELKSLEIKYLALFESVPKILLATNDKQEENKQQFLEAISESIDEND